MRRVLGRQADLFLTDGFTPTDALASTAGRAAEGAFISVPGVSFSALTGPGRAFARALSTVTPGAETDPGAIYAAQATAVLLDGMSRSDGTRASVRRQVFATQIRPGLAGPVTFDANGDILESPITLLRVRVGERSRGGFPDARLAQVMRPSRKLIAP
jgi:branched-chain amino acid transport system substrate-binding protein